MPRDARLCDDIGRDLGLRPGHGASAPRPVRDDVCGHLTRSKYLHDEHDARASQVLAEWVRLGSAS
jgi:hypothetical protein